MKQNLNIYQDYKWKISNILILTKKSLQKIDKKSYKNTGIYYIGYIIYHSDYENINSINPMYLIIGKVDGYIEENNGDKYLTFASTDKIKKVLEKYKELWDEIKYHIQTISAGKSGEYEKDYMRIKFSSDENSPLKKILKPHNLTIIVRFVFEEDDKYYPQVFLDECLYEV